MLAFVLAAAIDADMLMMRVASITDATMTIRQERQLTYTKKSINEDTKVWSAAWGPQGITEQLVSVKGKPVREKPGPSPDMDMVAVMRTRFHFTMADPPETDGPECDQQHCYVIAFTSKSDSELASKDRLKNEEAELIVSHLAGLIYMNAKTLCLVRILGHQSDGPFKKSLGVSIKSIALEYRQQIYEGIPVMKDSTISIGYTFFGFPGTSHRVYEYSDYRFAYPPAP